MCLLRLGLFRQQRGKVQIITSTSCACVGNPAKKMINCFRTSILLVLALCPLLFTASWAAQDVSTPGAASLPSETPAKFEPVTDSFDYTRRNVMIPMSDGVRLHTVILVPKGAKNAPILL